MSPTQPYPGPGEGRCWSCPGCPGCQGCKCAACVQHPGPSAPKCSAFKSVCACGGYSKRNPGPGDGYCYACPGKCTAGHAGCSICEEDGPAPPPLPPAPPAPPGPLCNINGTWNMTVGVGPVLNGEAARTQRPIGCPSPTPSEPPLPSFHGVINR